MEGADNLNDVDNVHKEDPERSSTTNISAQATAVSGIVSKIIASCSRLLKALEYGIRKTPREQEKSRNPILKTAVTTYTIVFLFSIILNKTTFYGRCVGRVDYSSMALGIPFYSPLGYSACESNTYTAANTLSYHSPITDNGYPALPVNEMESSHNQRDGPSWRTLNMLGSVDTNYIRLYGEWFRLFTAITLHAGWAHLLTNIFVHCLVLYIIEPEWGFYRCLCGYFVAGCGGYLVGAVLVPCLQHVGASGVHTGFLGALLPFCVEQWYEMGSPEIILITSITTAMVDFAALEKRISIHVHMGGYLFGVMFGFATIKSVALFDGGAPYQRFMTRFFSRWLKEETKQAYMNHIVKSRQVEEVLRLQYEHIAKENSTKWKLLKTTLGIYPFGPYRMRYRDIITRAIGIAIMVSA
ncbi:rhomboid 4 [Babesia caballi]|uniref:Rhomboid-like protease n=1 Tax=Babesia caballi TaxID=5871 RepID=A0AAV4LTW9_BABCB|nr:rhomboid 4 [Babesia caballi]